MGRLSNSEAILKGVQLLIRSQYGYELRQKTSLKNAISLQSVESVGNAVRGGLAIVERTVKDMFGKTEEGKGKYGMDLYGEDLQLEIRAQQLPESSRQRRVPSSRLARLASFANLAVGLGAGAVAEMSRRSVGRGKYEGAGTGTVLGSRLFLTPANVSRIADTLCTVRGAALKLGQMLSIQESSLISPELLDILQRVRAGADFMPVAQVHSVLRQELGHDWSHSLTSFDDKPFAAASIGQVHRAVTRDGKTVALKIQYPGVAEGIDSDIDNLMSVLNASGLCPKGLFLDQFVAVARKELRLECDYEREARAMQVFRRLLRHDPCFYVPRVFPELTRRRVLTTELVSGISVDKCVDQPQVVRDHIAAKFIQLCLQEIFQWRFMQTDPNWSNFFFGRDPESGSWRIILLDFGASRPYNKKFVDEYMKIIKAAYDNDEHEILKASREIGFLTGLESKTMERAHCEAISIMGETLSTDKAYDFAQQDVTTKIHTLIPVMLENRLTPPPEEIYSLHRKLSGAYLLATKLKSVVSCGPLFKQIHDTYRFGPTSHSIDIDSDSDSTGQTEHI